MDDISGVEYFFCQKIDIRLCGVLNNKRLRGFNWQLLNLRDASKEPVGCPPFFVDFKGVITFLRPFLRDVSENKFSRNKTLLPRHRPEISEVNRKIKPVLLPQRNVVLRYLRYHKSTDLRTPGCQKHLPKKLCEKCEVNYLQHTFSVITIANIPL